MSGTSSKLQIGDRRSKMPSFVPWLVFSAGWIVVLLIVTQFRMAWLCVGAGLLLGFLTDCAVDIFAAKNHQRRMRGEYREKYLSGNQEARKGDAAR